jgi:hypothetical protein
MMTTHIDNELPETNERGIVANGVKVEIASAYMVCEVTMMRFDASFQEPQRQHAFLAQLVFMDCSKAAALAFVIDQCIVATFGIPKINPFSARLALFLPITSTNSSGSIGKESVLNIRTCNIVTRIHLKVLHVIHMRHSRLGTIHKHRVIGRVLTRYFR